MEDMVENIKSESFFRNKKVLITGHSGFKGSWLCALLIELGAEVYGYSDEIPTKPALWELMDYRNKVESTWGDIRDLATLSELIAAVNPEIIFHLAAQPLVLKGYEDPCYTYDVNVMGTVNLLQAIRNQDSVRSVVIITTDKVYQNNEWVWGYRETDMLNGFDPYSNSKSCVELVVDTFRRSFFYNTETAISTVRAGNVIGGGDFSENRIIPDCVKSVVHEKELVVRNPNSIRPYQHVLEPLYAYCLVAQKQYEDKGLQGSYNIGPDINDSVTTQELVVLFGEKWGDDFVWKLKSDPNAPHEANVLRLDCTKIKNQIGWNPVWDIGKSVEKVVEWVRCWKDGNNIEECMKTQIEEYLESARK